MVGFIEPALSGDVPLLIADTVSVGVPIQAIVTTYGGSGCIRPDRSAIAQTATTVDITAYDSIWAGPEVCLPDWHAYTRPVDLQFLTPGPVLLRLHGRSPPDSAVAFERTITVRQ
jgi:hypothetical protein